MQELTSIKNDIAGNETSHTRKFKDNLKYKLNRMNAKLENKQKEEFEQVSERVNGTIIERTKITKMEK